jgi:hypothetical protein
MGYSIYNLRSGYRHEEDESEEFFEAAEKARRAVEKMHDLACEMEDRYSERYYGGRGGYGRRDREGWDEMDGMYGMRRRRDSRGRYM